MIRAHSGYGPHPWHLYTYVVTGEKNCTVFFFCTDFPCPPGRVIREWTDVPAQKGGSGAKVTVPRIAKYRVQCADDAIRSRASDVGRKADGAYRLDDDARVYGRWMPSENATFGAKAEQAFAKLQPTA